MNFWRTRIFCLLLIFIFGNLPLAAQDLPDVKEINEFYLGFLENLLVGDRAIPTLVITAQEDDVQGFVRFGTNEVAFSLSKGQEFVYEGNNNWLVETSLLVENKGVYIYSEGEVSVYAINQKPDSFDGTLVLPIDQLGDQYVVASHYEDQTKGISLALRQFNNVSLVLIVGVEDNTSLEIIPSVPVGNSTAPQQVILNAGQTFQLRAQDDLTGTQIRVLNSGSSCGRVAVFSGNKLADIGDPECGIFSSSHIFNQNYPVSSWGKEYVHVPLRDRRLGELVKVIAAFDGTQVNVGAEPAVTLNAGEYLTTDVPDGRALYISSSEPVGVFGYGKSYSCTILNPNAVESPANVENFGNPHFVNYAPLDQLKNDIQVNFHPVFFTNKHFAQLITRTANVGLMQIDGANIGNQFSPVPSNPAYSFAQIRLSEGVHRLSNAEGFTGYFYSVGPSQSYAVDFSLEYSNDDYEVTSSFDDLGPVGDFRISCLNEEGTWEITPSDPKYVNFDWDFGDGSGLKQGEEVNHAYTVPGEYVVEIKASSSTCEESELHFFKVLVKEVSGEISGPSQACPEVEELEYFFKSENEIGGLRWEISGGTEVSRTENSIIVNWGLVNPNAVLKAIPYTAAGCAGNPVEFSVVINQQILPKIPQGVEFVCDLDLVYTYSVTTALPGRTFEWFVDGGIIQGSATGPSIEVVWTGDLADGSVYFKESSTLDALCAGDSPRLEVKVNAGFEAQVLSKTNVTCFGNEDGQIAIEVLGGNPPYSFEWVHDASLDNAIVENLTPGIYSVVVTDTQGCQVSLENIEILEPELLEIVNILEVNPTCFGSKDGTVAIEVQGGVPPYSIDFPNSTIIGSTIQLENLDGKVYDFEVMDSNGCVAMASFELVEPAPAEVEFEIIQMPCPGQNNGAIRAIGNHGNGPYSFEWNSGEISDEISGLSSGNYQVEVTNAEGCTAVGSIKLLETAPQVRFPTGFDSRESEFGPISNCEIIDYSLSIINRWGQLIYSGSEPWNGSVELDEASPGTYSFVFKYTILINEEVINESIAGSFLKIN